MCWDALGMFWVDNADGKGARGTIDAFTNCSGYFLDTTQARVAPDPMGKSTIFNIKT